MIFILDQFNRLPVCFILHQAFIDLTAAWSDVGTELDAILSARHIQLAVQLDILGLNFGYMKDVSSALMLQLLHVLLQAS